MCCSNYDLLGVVCHLFSQYVSFDLIVHSVQQEGSRGARRALKLLLVEPLHRHNYNPLFGNKMLRDKMEALFSIWNKYIKC